MTKAPVTLQDLQRKMYVKAKAESVLALLGPVCARLQDGHVPRRL